MDFVEQTMHANLQQLAIIQTHMVGTSANRGNDISIYVVILVVQNLFRIAQGMQISLTVVVVN